MAEAPEAIPDEVMREAEAVLTGYLVACPNLRKDIATALLASEARGREKQKEADARIAEEHANASVSTVEGDQTSAGRLVANSIATAIRNQ